MSDEQQILDFEDPNQPLRNLPLARPLVFFDLETTGLDMQIDRIVQFAFLRVETDKTIHEWQELVNPGIPIPPEASRIHRITDEMVAGKAKFTAFAEKIFQFVQNCDLAGYNVVRFDLPFLQAEMERAGFTLDTTLFRIVDPLIIFHKRESRDLSAAYRFYCRKELHGAHDAMADVRATLEVLDGQLNHYRDLPREISRLAAYCRPEDDDRWVTPDRKFYWRHNQAIFSFGKHKGKSLQWVYDHDHEYLHWLASKEWGEETRRLFEAALQGRFPEKQQA